MSQQMSLKHTDEYGSKDYYSQIFKNIYITLPSLNCTPNVVILTSHSIGSETHKGLCSNV